MKKFKNVILFALVFNLLALNTISPTLASNDSTIENRCDIDLEQQ